MPESEYSDSVVVSVILAVLVVLLDFGGHRVFNLGSPPALYYVICGIVAFGLGFLIFQATKEKNLTIRFLGFAILGPLVEFVVLVFFGITYALAGVFLGILIYAFVGGLVFPLQNKLDEWL